MASSGQTEDWKARGVHLVGSLKFPDDVDNTTFDPPSANSVFRSIASDLPRRCKRVPDGEPANRNDFINCQDTVFSRSPWIFNDYERGKRSVSVPENAASLKIELNDVQYDEWAIDSWLDFNELYGHTETLGRNDMRFQVCLPTPVNVIARFVHPDFQAKIEPMYEEMMLAAVKRIQENSRPAELAIQLDCALEFAMLEGIGGPGDMWAPWFEASADALAERLARIARVVHPDVDLGLHLCYGDMYHRHFKEPADASKLVEFTNLVAAKVEHPLNFVHLPVPKDRDDDAYFAPLKDFRLSAKSDIYLGLVHPYDLDGTKRRMEAARKVVPQFGVSTECGWGRTPFKDVRSIIEIMNAVSDPA